jgi:hypothetical protein
LAPIAVSWSSNENARPAIGWERGHDVGPNLLSISNRTPDEVLANVLDPNREVAPNFQEYVVILDDGRVLTGIIAEETATSVTLRRAEAIEETRSAISCGLIFFSKPSGIREWPVPEICSIF